MIPENRNGNVSDFLPDTEPFEMQNDLKDIIQGIRSLPQVEAPAGFAATIMERLEAISAPESICREDCALCLSATGYFHIILGAAFVMALKTLHQPDLPVWIELQPFILFALGLIPMSAAVLLMKKTAFPLQAVYISVWTYIGCMALNGCAGLFCLDQPVHLAGILCCTVSGVVTGAGHLVILETIPEKISI